MLQPGPGEVTRLLALWSKGDKSALDDLLPIVYPELRRLAASYLRRERGGHTLQPTALVNEACLRILGAANFECGARGQFFAFAAQVMRNLLVSHAIRRNALKRGGGHQICLGYTEPRSGEPRVDILALDHALERLTRRDPRQGRIVELRFFAGLSEDEIAEVLGLSPSTIKREWRMARAILYKNLRPQAGAEARQP